MIGDARMCMALTPVRMSYINLQYRRKAPRIPVCFITFATTKLACFAIDRVIIFVIFLRSSHALCIMYRLGYMSTSL